MWFIIISFLLIIASLIPLINSPYWFFRIFEFGKVQLFQLFILLLVFGIIFFKKENYFISAFCIDVLIIVYLTKDLYPYSKLKKARKNIKSNFSSKAITIISANVYQENSDYEKLITLAQEHNPDLLLTMESDKKWEEGLSVLEKKYPYQIKIPLDNTYGMHLYSKLEITNHKVHFFVTDDIPSIQAEIKTTDGFKFDFFGVHPPPPSPTEEDNSKERDGEILSVGKMVQKLNNPCLVIGDFNNVAWAKSSILFKKSSKLIDARIGKGLFSTFHAKYWFLRFPIDLLFHSSEIYIEDLKTLDYFGSDHFPIYCSFYIDKKYNTNDESNENLNQENKEKIDEMIQEGKKEKSENRD